MPHPYQTESKTRTRYVMESGERLLELLSSEVQNTLGIAAVKLRALVEEAYVPPVTGPMHLRDDDIVGEALLALPYDKSDSDNVPIVAVRPGETLTRTPYFYTPTPRQIANAKTVQVEHGVHPADPLQRLSRIYKDEYMRNENDVRENLETTPLEDNDQAVCTPLTLRIPRVDGVTMTSLRWRPLLVVRYDPCVRHAPLGPLAQALMQAEQVLEHPAYVTEGTNGYEPLESAWLAEAQAIGAQVARLAGEQ